VGVTLKLGQTGKLSGYPIMQKTQLANCEALSEVELVKKHDRLVRDLALRFTSVDVDDLFQVGQLALIEAARTWSHRSQFWTYARRAVLGAMLDYATKEIGHTVPHALHDVENEIDFRSNVEEKRGRRLEPEDVPAPASCLDDKLEAHRLMNGLSEIEARVLAMHIRDDLDVRTIAPLLGRSKSDVHRILSGAMKTLRERVQA